VEMSGGVELPRITDAGYPLTLGPHAFYWLRLQRDLPADVDRRPRPIAIELEPERAALLLGPEWAKLLDGSVRNALEKRYLSPFLQRQGWFDRRTPTRVVISDWGTLADGKEPVLLVIVN